MDARRVQSHDCGRVEDQSYDRRRRVRCHHGGAVRRRDATHVVSCDRIAEGQPSARVPGFASSAGWSMQPQLALTPSSLRVQLEMSHSAWRTAHVTQLPIVPLSSARTSEGSPE